MTTTVKLELPAQLTLEIEHAVVVLGFASTMTERRDLLEALVACAFYEGALAAAELAASLKAAREKKQ